MFHIKIRTVNIDTANQFLQACQEAKALNIKYSRDREYTVFEAVIFSDVNPYGPLMPGAIRGILPQFVPAQQEASQTTVTISYELKTSDEAIAFLQGIDAMFEALKKKS